MLNEYAKQVQRFIRDQKQQYIDIGNIYSYINRARREVAGRTQCCRVLTPISGQCISATVVNGGSNYTSPTVTITPPDFPSGRPPNPLGAQATALATVQGGVITAVDIQYGGDGYFQPQASVTDSTGSGAEVTIAISPINQLNPGQEQYSFSEIDLSGVPGAESVLFIRGISIIYSNYRYSLPCYSFSTYQSMIRQYASTQYSYVPTFFSQLGQGTAGTLFAYPLASQLYQWEFDLNVLPQDLIDNQSVELIPQPWQDAVPYFAAHLAFLELQNLNSGKFFLDLYEKMVLNYSQYARVGRVVNPYGRYLWLCGAIPAALEFVQHFLRLVV